MIAAVSAHFSGLREDFFRTYVAFEPEEATTLGLHDGDDRLRDPASLDDRAAFFRRSIRALDAIDTASLDKANQADHAAMRAVAAWEAHAHDALREHERRVEWSLYPYTMICYARAQGLDVRARAAGVSRYLRAHEDNLARGLAAGRATHRSLVEHIIAAQLPGVIEDLGAIDPKAGAAYADHLVFLRDRVLPRAPEPFAIGEDEVALRLATLFDLDRSAAELTREARDHLASVQAAMIAIAKGLDPSIRSMPDVMERVRAEQGERMTRAEDVEPLYRAIIDRATRFSAERGLLHLPDNLDLGMDVYPAGLRAFGAGTNWPAPLLDGSKKGQFVLNPDPSKHVVAWAAVGAIHEGVPGHFLQSAVWQARYGAAGEARTPPVRFFGVADDVAFPRGFLRPMLTIEGWAVYAEELLREAGFHEGRDHLFACVGHAIRAARTIVDLGLHTGAMSREQAASFLMDEAGMPKASALGEVERYGRLPLQAMTYFVGQREIERLRDHQKALLGGAFDLASFHDALLAEGPITPAAIRRVMA